MELLKSPAKINLFLDVLSIDNDGFHSIKSILTLIDLHDEIIIKDSDSLDINFSGEFSDEINQNNHFYNLLLIQHLKTLGNFGWGKMVFHKNLKFFLF